MTSVWRGLVTAGLVTVFFAVPPSVAAETPTSKAVQQSQESERDLIARYEALIEDGRAQEAHAVAERGLTLAAKTHGPESMEAADWHHRAGAALHQQKKYAEATSHFERALQIQEKVRGRDHIDNVATMLGLSLSYIFHGRGPEAEALLKRIVVIYEKRFGPEDQRTLQMIEVLAIGYGLQGRHAEAIAVWERLLAIRERKFGPQSKQVGETLFNLARSHNAMNRFVEGEAYCRRALAILETVLKPDDLELARLLQFHGLLLERLGRFAEAESRYKRALSIRENGKAPPDDIITTLGRLAVLCSRLDREAEAEAYARRALTLAESVHGKDSDQLLWLLSTLGQIQTAQGRYADADLTLRRAIAIAEKKSGPTGYETAKPLSDLAMLHIIQGRLADAEAYLKRALSIIETHRGVDHYDAATPLANLGTLYEMQSRFAEAEPLLRRSLAIFERVDGPDHPDTAAALNNLAVVISNQGRDDEAEPLFRRVLAIRERALGRDHPQVATTLISIAGILREKRQRNAEAEQMLRRALSIMEAAHPAPHPLTATALTKLAFHLSQEGRYAEAEPLLLRAKTIFEQVSGPDHINVAGVLTELAWIYWGQHRLKDAEALLVRALASFRKVLPANHREINHALYVYGAVLFDLGKSKEAYATAKEAAGILADRWRLSTTSSLQGGWRENLRSHWVYVQQIRAAHALARQRPTDEPALLAESFSVAQRVGLDDTAQAIARVSSRFSADAGALGGLLREQQDLLQRLGVLEKLAADAQGSNEAGVRAQGVKLQQEADAVRAKLGTLDATLRRDHPAYAELMISEPVPLAATQAMLGDHEAVAMIIVGEQDTYVFAVSKTAATWSRSPLKESDLAAHVTALRRQLDPDQWQASFAPFDRALAHRLYRELWAPLEGVLAGKTNVFVVPTGPLTSLPLSVLVTEAPAGGVEGDANPQALRDTAWLAKRHALTTLPSISSLKALRLYAGNGSASEPFAGFGDPALGAPQTATRTRSVASVFRGATPDLDELRTLSPLPGTAVELKALAKALGASETADVYLRERATEAQLKAANLTRKRVIAFATHALTAGDLGLGEPGLVFTPPASASERDDGYLAASEAARLDLRADWIILSACNTAAGEAPGAKGLSGLARAFFLAGARSLLVSHWPVWDDAAGRITTAAVKSFQANPSQGRAEALRQAALGLMADTSSPRFAHPAAWAPFVLVGEQRAN